LLPEAGEWNWYPLIRVPLGVRRIWGFERSDWGYRVDPVTRPETATSGCKMAAAFSLPGRARTAAMGADIVLTFEETSPSGQPAMPWPHSTKASKLMGKKPQPRRSSLHGGDLVILCVIDEFAAAQPYR
jgi:hypothetical protein